MVPQDVTERLLADALGVEAGPWSTKRHSFRRSEQDDCVSVTLERNGEAIQLKASFVVGCDGAHSAVRHLLHLPFKGAEYEDTFLLADVETNDDAPRR